MKDHRTTGVLLILLGVALTGCVGPTPPQEAQGNPTPAIPTPTQIIGPESREDCTTTLGKSAEDLEDPDRVTVRCADKTITLAGTFRDRYTNVYDPKTANDITRIIVVGGEVRVWTGYGDGTCLILHTPGSPPVECKPTQQQPAETPQQAPAPTKQGEQNS